MGEGGRDGGEALEGGPGRRLADRRVRVVGKLGRDEGRVRDADREARAHQGEEDRDLPFGERVLPVVAADDGDGRGERIGLPEERVGRRDRRLGDPQPVVHVAEVDDARNRVRLGAGPVDEGVPVVRVAVDHLSGQRRERRLRFLEAVEEALRQRPARRIGDARQGLAGPRRAGEVPLQLAVGGRVVEAGERAVERPQQAAEALVQLGGARSGLRERHAGGPREEEHEAALAAAVRHAADRPPAPGGCHPRQRERGRRALEVLEHLGQHLDEGRVPLRVHQLEDERAAVAFVEAEVVVVLAGEGRGRPIEPERLPGEARGEVGRGRRGGVLLHHRRILSITRRSGNGRAAVCSARSAS